MSKFPTRPAQLVPYLVVMLICSILIMAAQIEATSFDIYAMLRYERLQIAQGELWRLLTSHFLHTNFMHFSVNILGLSLLWMLHGDYVSPRNFSINVLILCVGISIAMWLWSSNIQWYVGLSGVLHGLFVWGVVIDIYKGRKSGYLLLIGVLAKLIEEQVFNGQDSYMSELIEARVAVDAHLYGALIGLLLGFAAVIIGLQKTSHKNIGSLF